MFKTIHDKFKKHVQKDFVQDKFDGNYPFGLNDEPLTRYKSFGEKNPDKVFYVIFREPFGSGFFSNFAHVVRHFKIAQDRNFIPVVDFKNFKTLYSTKNPINGTENAWEYYFKQVSPYSLDEVYQSKNVLFCSGEYPYKFEVTDEEDYEYSKKIFNVNQDILDTVREYEHEFENKRVLGVHFRGKEMNICPGHGFGPTEKQIFRYIDEMLDKYNMDKIFLVTEEKRYLDAVVKRYGEKVFYTNAFRIPNENSFNVNPRENHRYLLGREVLVDFLLLLKCKGLLHGGSCITCYAKLLNPDYDVRYQVHNGYNVSNKYVARYLYRIKKMLPKKLGGLLDEVIIVTNEKGK